MPSFYPTTYILCHKRLSLTKVSDLVINNIAISLADKNKKHRGTNSKASRDKIKNTEEQIKKHRGRN